MLGSGGKNTELEQFPCPYCQEVFRAKGRMKSHQLRCKNNENNECKKDMIVKSNTKRIQNVTLFIPPQKLS